MYRRLRASLLSLALLPLLFPATRQPTINRAGAFYTGTQFLPGQEAAAQVQFGGVLGFQYNPPVVFISTGDTVTWQGDFSMHPLVSDGGLWPSKSSGTEFSHTFDQPGIYRYHCALHGGLGGVGMSGTVVVGGSIFLPMVEN